jgi:hypothetical protein
LVEEHSDSYVGELLEKSLLNRMTAFGCVRGSFQSVSPRWAW